MRLDPVSLRLFVSVVELGSIAAAAEREHIAAAAVSKRMSELESQLRVPLLMRTNKGAEATPAGQALLGHAHRLLRDLDEIVVQMRDWAGGVRGQVRVHANISAITQFLPQEIAAFLMRYPQVQVHLQEAISTDVAQAVADNEADVGIGIVGAHSAGLELFDYRDDHLAVIAPAGHALHGRDRVTLADVLDHDFVGLHSGSAINTALARAAAEAERPLAMRIQVTSYDALSRMVAAGLGIGVMPEQLAREYVTSLGIGCLVLDEPWAHRQLRLCVRAYDGLPPAARLLVDALRAQAVKG